MSKDKRSSRANAVPLWLRRLRFALMYLGRPPWDSGVVPPELLAFLDGRPPGRAIDLGCGTGTNVIGLARRGWHVTGVDFVPRAIRKAKRRARQAGVTADLRVGDVTRLEGIGGPFDFALDLGCFHGLGTDGQAAYLERLYSLLAPGGHWLLYAFLQTEPGGRGISAEMLERIQECLTLLQRQDGTERGMRPSAYFLFQR